ncbi:hypothetical protein [Novosphingobium sp. PC22D]|uniref:hypothetical protein n=1 Tax=Novosphingobium sp. PC22D TaxID=1962403 RepID=UPI0014398778|nr:hypothetical protein [Novosphingobium sp. PC22D]
MATRFNSPSQRTTSWYEAIAERDPEFVERIQSLRSRNRNRLARLSTLAGRERHGEVRKLLRSGSMHVVYAFDALKAKRRPDTANAECVEALAARCNPFMPSREPVRHGYATSGRAIRRTRIVQDFGPLKRMHQLLVADVLRSLHPPRQDQFLFGGGMPMALKAIEDAFRQGYTHAAEVDLIDFYGRMRPPGLADLLRPLPRAVTDNVVWDHAVRRGLDDALVVCSEDDDPSASGLVGLSLGAATSPVVGEVIIRSLLDTACMGQVVTYADNILILGRGQEDVARWAAQLEEVAQGLEAGPLALRINDTVAFTSRHLPVQFASHWGSAIRHRLNWEPNGRKLAEHLIVERSTVLTDEEIGEVESKISHLARAYPMWRTRESWEACRLAELAAVRYYNRATPPNLSDAKHKLIIAYLTCGRQDLREILPDGTTRQHRERRMALYNAGLELLAVISAEQAA